MATETICFHSGTISLDSNRDVGGAKTICYKQLVIDLSAVKLQLRVLLTKLSDAYFKVSPCFMKKNPLLNKDFWKLLLVTGALTVVFTASN